MRVNARSENFPLGDYRGAFFQAISLTSAHQVGSSNDLSNSRHFTHESER